MEPALGVVVAMKDSLIADAFLSEVNRNYRAAFDRYHCTRERETVNEFAEQRMIECLKNMNVWSVVAEQAIVKRDKDMLIESLSNLNKWEYAFNQSVTSSEIESLLNMKDQSSSSSHSIQTSLYSLQLQIVRNRSERIQPDYQHVESLLIDAYRQILSIPQQRRLQIQIQQLYTMQMITQVSQRLPGSSLIIMHLRNIPSGRSDSTTDHINLLRIRQSLYCKIEEKEVANNTTILSDFEWTTIQIAKYFLQEEDYTSTLETLISASHRSRISMYFVQEMGSIVAQLSTNHIFSPSLRETVQNHLIYNRDCLNSSELSALLSAIASSKQSAGSKDKDKNKFFDEIYSLLLNSLHADYDNKQAWNELASLLISLSHCKVNLPFVNPDYLVATIISALRLDCSNMCLLFWLFFSVNNYRETLSEEVFKLIETVPLYVFTPYLYYLFLPRSPLIPISRRLLHSLLSLYPGLACFYLEWNQSFIKMDYGTLYTVLPDRVNCGVVGVVNYSVEL